MNCSALTLLALCSCDKFFFHAFPDLFNKRAEVMAFALKTVQEVGSEFCDTALMHVLQLTHEQWRQRGINCLDEIQPLPVIHPLMVSRGILVKFTCEGASINIPTLNEARNDSALKAVVLQSFIMPPRPSNTDPASMGFRAPLEASWNASITLAEISSHRN